MSDPKDQRNTPMVPGRPSPLPRRVQLPGKTASHGFNASGAGDTKQQQATRTMTMTITDPQIVCPTCQTEIKLTESLAAPLIAETRKQFEAQLAAKQVAFERRESALRQAQDELAKAQQSIDDQVAARLQTERTRIAEAEAVRARTAMAGEIGERDRQLSELQQLLSVNNEKLAAAQKAQAEILRKERELDDSRRELELTVEKQVQAALVEVRSKARFDAEDELKTKISEKETLIAGMQRQIDELRRKAEQGSQQLQGEAQELELEAVLRARFPSDLIEPVAKGEFGGDVLHRVLDPAGQACGAILWESKRTRNWSDGWLAKLRDDQRSAKAEIAIIVSTALPKDLETFDLKDNVWVTAPRFTVPLAIVLRQSLVDLAASRITQQGQQGKTEQVYAYLTGPRFRQRVEAIIERFSDMQADLDRERKAMTRLWARREEQLRGVLESTCGLYGDLQGIAGRALPELDSLDLPLIEASTDAAE